MQKMMGLSRYDYLSSFDRVNLLPYFPGKHKRDDKFPMTPAKLAALVMLPLLAGREVILVGRNVADAFKLKLDFHEWTDLIAKRYCPIDKGQHKARICVIPHPSGRNHWYNNEDNVLKSKEFWERFTESRKSLSSGLQAPIS